MDMQAEFYAKVLFENRVLRANGTQYQQLFWSVMKAEYGTEFVQVQPQGRKGDGGNDGYLPALGHYFQVYGPADPNEKVTKAASKLDADFQKLKKTWGQNSPIDTYFFAYNDKYEGIYKEIAQELATLEQREGTRCRPFGAADLENIFMGLSGSAKVGILGTTLPEPAHLTQLDYTALRHAVEHLMNSPAAEVVTRFGELPELNEKIQLNRLSEQWADLLRSGARQVGHVEKYFAKNSHFMKQALRDHLVNHYLTARDNGRALLVLPEGAVREDLIFADFRSALMPMAATASVARAIDVLISYYFEACDIFDPHADKGSPSASA